MAAVVSSQIDHEVTETAAARAQISARSIGLVAVGLVTAGHLPLVVNYFRGLLRFDHYQFVPMVLIGVPALMIVRGRGIPRTVWRRGFPFRELLISCATLTVASVFCSPWVAMISLWISTGLFLRYYAGPYWRVLMPVWLLLLLIVRPPLRLDQSLIHKLQIETSKVSSVVLEHLGVMHLMDGNVLVIPERRFLVEEACSGINSVFALLTAAAFYAVCVRVTVVRAVLLMSSAVFWACFMNLVRVAATIFAFEQLQLDLGKGTVHTITGLVTFALAVLFVAFTDQMIRFFLDPIDPQAVDFWEQRLNPYVQWWNRTRPPIVDEPHDPGTSAAAPGAERIPATIVIGGIALTAAGWQMLALHVESQSQDAPVVIAHLDADSFPGRLGNWSQANYEIEHRPKNSILGDVSKIWTFRSPAYAATVSVDYPFRGWHTLDGCYRGNGWKIDQYRAVPITDGENGERRWISEVQMHRPSGEKALLLFSLMNRHGRTLDDPTIGSFWIQTARRLVARIRRPFAVQFPELDPDLSVTTQLQMLIAFDGPAIPPEVIEEARRHYATFQSEIANRLAAESTLIAAGETP